MNNKVIIISNFHENNSISRTNIAFNYFVSKGFDAVVLYSTFSHSLKKQRLLDNPKFFPLKTISYNTSFSMRRIISYLLFAYRVFIYLKRVKVDIIYFNLPPNILALAVYSALRKKCKYIVDIVDLWPESIPHNNSLVRCLVNVVGTPIKSFRNKALQFSNYKITESTYFYNTLNLNNYTNAKTIQLKKTQTEAPSFLKTSDELSLVYIGNIGLIYDYASLIKIILKVQRIRLVTLHIIGLGPMKDWLIEKLKKNKINYYYHGPIFDEKLKKKILETCWFGYNGYKNFTEVALSYKSIDYLSYGLPLINSAKKDTVDLIKSNKIGFNFSIENLEMLIDKLSSISLTDVMTMKKRAYTTYVKQFSEQSYYDEMDTVLQELRLKSS